MHSQDPCILKYATIVKDISGDNTYFFHEYFKGAPRQEKKENLNMIY